MTWRKKVFFCRFAPLLLMCASSDGPRRRSQCCARWVGASTSLVRLACNLLVAAADGTLTRRWSQALANRVLAHGSGRFVGECTRLRARLHTPRVLGSVPMLPESTITRSTGEETRMTTSKKGTMSKGRPPFYQLQCITYRGPSACCVPDSMYSHHSSVPRLRQNTE